MLKLNLIIKAFPTSCDAPYILILDKFICSTTNG